FAGAGGTQADEGTAGGGGGIYPGGGESGGRRGAGEGAGAHRREEAAGGGSGPARQGDAATGGRAPGLLGRGRRTPRADRRGPARRLRGGEGRQTGVGAVRVPVCRDGPEPAGAGGRGDQAVRRGGQALRRGEGAGLGGGQRQQPGRAPP